MRMNWQYSEGKPLPVRKITTYLLGVVALSFVLAHCIGKEMTRDGQPAKPRPNVEDVKPSVPGQFQDSINQ